MPGTAKVTCHGRIHGRFLVVGDGEIKGGATEHLLGVGDLAGQAGGLARVLDAELVGAVEVGVGFGEEELS